MKLLIPLALLLLGLGGGVGAGFALRPAPGPVVEATVAAEPQGTDHAASEPESPPPPRGDSGAGDHGGAEPEYIKLNNQFVVPVVTKDAVEFFVILTLSVEITAGGAETVYRHEPKLRDEFLQVMFEHANMGGFRGAYTDTSKLAVLRTGLFEVARKTLGASVRGVLITDIARQNL